VRCRPAKRAADITRFLPDANRLHHAPPRVSARRSRSVAARESFISKSTRRHVRNQVFTTAASSETSAELRDRKRGNGRPASARRVERRNRKTRRAGRKIHPGMGKRSEQEHDYAEAHRIALAALDPRPVRRRSFRLSRLSPYADTQAAPVSSTLHNGTASTRQSTALYSPAIFRSASPIK
jgi:hypothetical protein